MRPEEVEEKVSALEAENERLKNSEALVGALLKKAEFRNAKAVWGAVLSILRSDTPDQTPRYWNLEVIAEHNLRALETILGEEPSEHGR